MWITYCVCFVVLLISELLYFKIADRCNIIDKPNERSSHSTIVLRGGGIVFLLAVWLWSFFFGCLYPWFLAGLTLVAGISFIDDIKSLPDGIRLVGQFIAMVMMFYELDILHLNMWWIVLLALVVSVGASNVMNFMDGINGMTGGYALATLIPLFLLNSSELYFQNSFILTIILADVVFCIFNMRPQGKAKCFAGDVGSIGMAFILLFLIGRVIILNGDITYLIFLIVYGVDGVLTICHRIMLHENLGKAHRKHAYQLMCNELKIGHVKVSLLYSFVQLLISFCFIYVCPNSINYHWIYLLGVFVLLSIGYIWFMKKYYHLYQEFHELSESI